MLVRIFLGLSTSIHPCLHCSLAWLTIIRFSCNMLLYSHWCWVNLDWTLQLKGSVYSWETPDVLLPGLRWLDQNKQLLQRGKSPWEGNASIWVKIPLRGTRAGCWCPWGWKGWVWTPRKCLVTPKGAYVWTFSHRKNTSSSGQSPCWWKPDGSVAVTWPI